MPYNSNHRPVDSICDFEPKLICCTGMGQPIHLHLHRIFVLFLLLASPGVSHWNGKTFHTVKACLTNAGIPNQRIVGYGITSNRSVYTQLNYQWNLRGGIKTPLGYILASSTSDVQTAVNCCRSSNVRVVGKGGGHSFEKYGFGDKETFIIDLQLMNTIVMKNNRKICHVGPGVLTGQFAWTLYSQGGFVVPHGTCPTIGISGFALGGGYGHLDRLHGLTSDNILELEMVDYTGSVLKANKDTNPDLYWALRGAGIGSYGIVTRFTFKMHEAPARVVRGSLTYDLYKFPQVFNQLQNLIESNPIREIYTKLNIKNGQIIIEINDLQMANETRGLSLVQTILSSFPDNEIGQSDIASLSYPEFLLVSLNANDFGLKNASGLVNLTRLSEPQTYSKSNSFYMKNMIDYADMTLLLLLLEEIPDKNTIMLELYAVGGADDKLRRNDTAFVHRAPNLYKVRAYFTGRPSSDRLERAKAIAWLRRFFKTTKETLKHTESYQNNADADMKDYLQRYYGSNLHRLIQIKQQIDPENYFCNPQSIPLSL